nr:YncE family protein [Mycobacterium sp.]
MAVAPAGVPDAGDVFVTNSGSDTVSVIGYNTAHDTFSVVDTITVTAPTGVAVAPAGVPDAGDVFVTNDVSSGTVSVINPSTEQVFDTITVGSSHGFENEPQLAVIPAGFTGAGDVYVANMDSGTVSVLGAGLPQ